jgi:hypothetical protein
MHTVMTFAAEFACVYAVLCFVGELFDEAIGR